MRQQESNLIIWRGDFDAVRPAGCEPSCGYPPTAFVSLPTDPPLNLLTAIATVDDHLDDLKVLEEQDRCQREVE
jgi:hypothetical protein